MTWRKNKQNKRKFRKYVLKYLTNTRDVTDKHVTEGWRWMSGISFEAEGRFLLEDAGNGLENQ